MFEENSKREGRDDFRAPAGLVLLIVDFVLCNAKQQVSRFAKHWHVYRLDLAVPSPIAIASQIARQIKVRLFSFPIESQ